MTQDIENEGLIPDPKRRGPVANQRRTVRYIRKDIKACIRKQNWLSAIGIDWFRKSMPAALLDISNRGCLIGCPEPLSVHAKVIVMLTFETGMRFEIKGTVVRKAEGRDEYGIKFASYDDVLGEYMLQTQEELTFK